MRKILTVIGLMMCVTLSAQDLSSCAEVLLETDSGKIRIALYNETPKHRDNFLKLVKEGFYDGVLFHRVIENFMIQTGDSTTRHAQPGELLGEAPYENYTIPAEIRFPQIFHKRGSVAAAREGDDVNPERASSMGQFYIVWGRRFNSNGLDDMEERVYRATKTLFSFPQEIREAYYKIGGTPHLDTQYTVFGEVLEGLDVVDKIQRMPGDENNRPLTDIKIIKATVIKDL